MKSLFTFITFSASIISVFAQSPPNIEWQKSLGGSSTEQANSIIQTNDGGYIVACQTQSIDGDVNGNHGFQDFWIIKLNSLGNIEWQKCLGGSGFEKAESIQQTLDGGYIIAGFTLSNDGDVTGNHGDVDAWVVKLDILGNIEWQKSLGGSSWDYANSICQTLDLGYILTGSTGSNDGDVNGNHGSNDCWVVKLDSLGSVIWQKVFGGTNSESGNSINQTQNGGYVIAGQTNSNDGDVTGNHGDVDAWVIKISDIGDIEWQKTYGGSGTDFGTYIHETQFGGYVLTGHTNSNDGDITGNNGTTDSWVIKISDIGDIEWQKCVGGSSYDNTFKIIQTQDLGYVTSGRSLSNDGDILNNKGYYDFWLFKLNNTGNLSWTLNLGGTGFDGSLDIEQTLDGGYIVAGTSDSNNGDVTGNHGSEDCWVVKLGPDSSLITSEAQKKLGIIILTLYPNPASDFITLELEGIEQESYQIFDLQGKIVVKGLLNQGKNLLNISGLAKGSYIIRTKTTGMNFEVMK